MEIDMIGIEETLRIKLEELRNRARDGKKGLVIQQCIDPLDRAQDESHRMEAASLTERDRELIGEVAMALERIEEGQYGLCIRCEGEIPARRLECVPWATLCVDCQGHSERTKGAGAKPRKLEDKRRDSEALTGRMQQ